MCRMPNCYPHRSSRAGIMRGAFLAGALLTTVCSALLPGSAYAETISIGFDWTGITAADRDRILALQENGRLPVPLIFIQGKPVGMVGDSFELDTIGDSVTIDIGISNLLERPLYSIQLPIGANPAASVTVTSTQLAAYGKPEAGKLPLILEGTGDQAVMLVTSEAGGRGVNLPVKTYLALADIVTAQDHDTQWLEWSGVDMYQRDATTGDPITPIFATFGTPKNVITAERNGELKQPYAKNIDVNWMTNQWRNLMPDLPEPLMLKSVPSAAEIHVSGVKQSLPTESTIPVVRYLWPEVFIRKDKYLPCQVDPLKVVPPLRTGEPSVFTCKLKKK